MRNNIYNGKIFIINNLIQLLILLKHINVHASQIIEKNSIKSIKFGNYSCDVQYQDNEEILILSNNILYTYDINSFEETLQRINYNDSIFHDNDCKNKRQCYPEILQTALKLNSTHYLLCGTSDNKNYFNCFYYNKTLTLSASQSQSQASLIKLMNNELTELIRYDVNSPKRLTSIMVTAKKHGFIFNQDPIAADVPFISKFSFNINKVLLKLHPNAIETIKTKPNLINSCIHNDQLYVFYTEPRVESDGNLKFKSSETYVGELCVDDPGYARQFLTFKKTKLFCHMPVKDDDEDTETVMKLSNLKLITKPFTTLYAHQVLHRVLVIKKN